MTKFKVGDEVVVSQYSIGPSGKVCRITNVYDDPNPNLIILKGNYRIEVIDPSFKALYICVVPEEDLELSVKSKNIKTINKFLGVKND